MELRHCPQSVLSVDLKTAASARLLMAKAGGTGNFLPSVLLVFSKGTGLFA